MCILGQTVVDYLFPDGSDPVGKVVRFNSIPFRVVGVLLGVSLSVGLQQFLHVATQIEPWSIIMSFAVCTFTGVFFGWYPAKKAARLDPIEAIRYE